MKTDVKVTTWIIILLLMTVTVRQQSKKEGFTMKPEVYMHTQSEADKE